MTIEGMQMWLAKWSPDWRPEIDSPIVPVWVLLPELPFHCHASFYIRQILNPIGIPIGMDNVAGGRTRPGMAKVRVEIDLTKPRIHKLWIGVEEENSPLKGFYQKLEYETMPKYCTHCSLLGHAIDECRVLARKKKLEEENQLAAKRKDNNNKNKEGKTEDKNSNQGIASTKKDHTKHPDNFDTVNEQRGGKALTVEKGQTSGSMIDQGKNKKSKNQGQTVHKYVGNSNFRATTMEPRITADAEIPVATEAIETNEDKITRKTNEVTHEEQGKIAKKKAKNKKRKLYRKSSLMKVKNMILTKYPPKHATDGTNTATRGDKRHDKHP
ncbi:uncharacterized protein LOC132619608 [Lycium barbarum]|uniref:uncharacterized protein LOC132619608 n=1 Tax=Lycium barbarum TaxID=112863 RepID=UPI00293F144B|nr:uncharacterized protein LOC132619608 [Lycium barbarum]